MTAQIVLISGFIVIFGFLSSLHNEDSVIPVCIDNEYFARTTPI